LRDYLVIKELNSSDHTLSDTIEILQRAIGRVVVLVDVQSTVATKGREEVTILWKVTNAPNGRLVCDLGESCITLLWVIGLEIEDVEFRFESGRYELVHGDVLTVEFDSADTICYIGIPTQTIGAQVK
jgi:hypothetical protein